MADGLRGRKVVLLAVCFVTVAGFGFFRFAADVRDNIDSLAIANSDSQQWSLAQLEVEFGKLRLALMQASPDDPASIADARRRFDIFYSRVSTVLEGRDFQKIAASASISNELDRVLNFRSQMAELIDVGDPPLASVLPRLRAETDALSDDVRRISLQGVRVFAALAKEKREEVFQSLVKLATLTAILVAVLTAGFVALWYFWRFGQSKANSLRAAKLRLEAVIATSLDAVIVVDQDMEIVEFNGAAERIFGYERGEAIGRAFGSLIVSEGDLETHAKDLSRAVDGTGSTSTIVGKGLVELQAQRKDGTIFPCEVSVSSAWLGKKQIFVSYIRDITERVAAQEELIVARDNARAGERAKAAFVAVMSHEIRTPLNGVLGGLDLLRTTTLDDRQKNYVAAMEQAGQILLQHVNDVLDIERLDAGKLDLAKVAFDPVKVGEQIAEAQRLSAEAHGNILKVVPVGPLPGAILGDPVRIRQVLVNLVGNACKFTRDGEITIEIEYMFLAGQVEYRVIDTGIGIAEADLERIFDDFVSLKTDTLSDVAGTGLGLGIARRLVQAMDGTLEAESEPGSGSVFCLTLPAAVAGARDQDQITRFPPGAGGRIPSAPSMKILLAEDNKINTEIVSEMLRQDGHQIVAVGDGQQAVRTAEGDRYDAILLDLNMPVMNGLEAARAIRQGKGPNIATPIVAVTANVLPDMVRTLEEAGCDKVLPKPLLRDPLRTALAECAQRAVSGPMTAGAADVNETARSEMKDVLGDDKFHALQQSFLEEGRAALPILGELLAAGDLAKLAKTAHRLAGSSAFVGAQHLGAALQRIEVLALGGRGDEIGHELDLLEPIWRETVAIIEEEQEVASRASG